MRRKTDKLLSGLMIALCILTASTNSMPVKAKEAIAAGTEAAEEKSETAGKWTEETAALSGDAASRTVITIASSEDWKQLVRSCRLDIWSQDQRVELGCDLELGDEDMIPTFGGIFDGNGHTITLALSGEGDYRGVFRYLQEGAVVQNLKVSGSISSEGSYIGGIVGSNGGTVRKCSFDGSLSGKNSTGGIAGINEVSGQIINCEGRGTVAAQHYTGGISGENYGTIVYCTNESGVNTHAAEVVPQLDEINWEQFNDTENLAACTDTGGIAGYSKGVIQGCTNKGSIGYAHTGYNVGGIVGRQSGQADGCINYGTVLGRKEVGGIAGQAEPYTLLKYDEDTLQKLMEELNTLQELLQEMMQNAKASGQSIDSSVTRVLDLTDSAGRDIQILLDQTTAIGNTAVDTVNQLSARLAKLLDQMVPVLDEMEKAAAQVKEALDKLKEATQELKEAGEEGEKRYQEIQAVIEELEQSNQLMAAAAEQMRADLGRLQAALGSNDVQELASIIQDLEASAGQYVQAAADFAEGVKELWEVLDIPLDNPVVSSGNAGSSWDPMLQRLKEFAEQLNQLEQLLSGGASSMQNILSSLRNIAADQAGQPALQLPKPDSSFYEAQNRLKVTLNELSSAIRSLSGSAASAGNQTIDDMQKINDQMKGILQLFGEAKEEALEEEELIVDVSQEISAQEQDGVISGSRNYGAVEGDINIGGCVGAMALEFDFDPEDDVIRQGDSSLNRQYLTRVAVRGCENHGNITARKDYAGGIAGRMSLGLIEDCQGYGMVKSTGGSYVGGIAGASDSDIRNCQVRSRLSGIRYVGGIAGQGKNISGSYTLVQIDEAVPYSGAIAGKADGEVRDNFFVSSSLGGVDGISYAGQSWPSDYEELLKTEGLPEEFTGFTLTFSAGETVVETRSLSYGENVEPSAFPQVPEREGFRGEWELSEPICITYDTVVEAVYTPWTSLLAGDDEQRHQILAEGQFAPELTLHMAEDTSQGPKLTKKQRAVGQWSVSLEEEFTALRIAMPDTKTKYTVYCKTGKGDWQELSHTVEGSYLRCELTAAEAVICLAENQSRGWIWAAAAGAAVIVLLGVIFGVIRLRRKSKAN